ncbi:MAG: class I SAM-dependent methyltransferase [Porticoccaceae bacterium]
MSGWKDRAWQLEPLHGETGNEYQDRVNRQYFQEQILENQEYWFRLGMIPDFHGKAVLDFGCGHGALSLDIALKGAAEVVGVDLDLDRINFARQNIKTQHPESAPRISFLARDVTKTDWSDRFDYIVSKDAIEHIDDLPPVFKAFAEILKPGGALILGFGPLYYSPYGDHTRLSLPLLWIHAYLPERLALAWASRRQGRKIASVSALGLNKLTPRQFRSLLATGPWHIDFLRYNRGHNALMPVFRALRRIPFFEKYFTISIYTFLSCVK